jgi:hypothetical protein
LASKVQEKTKWCSWLMIPSGYSYLKVSSPSSSLFSHSGSYPTPP